MPAMNRSTTNNPLWYSRLVQQDLKNLTREELSAEIAKLGEPAYRVDQILSWIYQQRAISIATMSNLSKELREKLVANYSFTALELIRKQGSHDTTQKFLWKLSDGRL